MKVSIHKIIPGFKDARGSISDLVVEQEIHHVGIIESESGVIRGMHYRVEWQWNYLLAGKARIVSWHGPHPEQHPDQFEVNAGHLIEIPPLKVCRMEFLEKSVILYMNEQIRIINGKETGIIKVDYPYNTQLETTR